MASDKIRVGLIGANPTAGFAPRTHLPALLNLPEYEIVAVCTSKPETAKAAASHFNVPLAFHEYEKMVSHPDVDLVDVCVRAPLHHQMVLAAIESDKHVFCEWPLGINLHEAEEMAAKSRASNKAHMVGLQGQYDPNLLYMKDLVSTGYIGKILSCNMKLFVAGRIHLESPDIWEADRKNGASALSIGGGHSLDVLEMCVGKFSEISCQVSVQTKQRKVWDINKLVDVTSPDHILMHGSLINDAVFSATVAYIPWHGSGWELEIYGSEGMLVATSHGYPQLSPVSLKGGKASDKTLAPMFAPDKFNWIPETVPNGEAVNVAQLFRSLSNSIVNNKPVHPDFEHALRMHRVLDAIEQSSDTGLRQVIS